MVTRLVKDGQLLSIESIDGYLMDHDGSTCLAMEMGENDNRHSVEDHVQHQLTTS